MSMKMTREQAAALAAIYPDQENAPRPAVVDRIFHMPPALYALTVGGYLGFIGIMAIAFGNPALLIPLVIFVVVIVAGFGLPYLWVKLAPDSGQRTIDWGRFRSGGVDTLTGRLTSGEAAAQVLTLPILIFLWGIAVAIIASTVSG